MGNDRSVEDNTVKKYVMKKFQDRLEELRKNKNLTDEKIAGEIGISLGSLKKYLCDEKPSFPTYEKLIQIASYFDTTPDYLCGYCDNIDELYLRNLAIIVKKLDLDIEINEDVLTISCNDKRIVRFFEDEYNEAIPENVKCARLVNFHGKLMFEEEFRDLKKNLYLYSHNMEIEPYDNSPKELDDTNFKNLYDSRIDDLFVAISEAKKETSEDDEDLIEKLIEWKSTGGHPKRLISDEYYDFIYRFEEYR